MFSVLAFHSGLLLSCNEETCIGFPICPSTYTSTTTWHYLEQLELKTGELNLKEVFSELVEYSFKVVFEGHQANRK